MRTFTGVRASVNAALGASAAAGALPRPQDGGRWRLRRVYVGGILWCADAGVAVVTQPFPLFGYVTCTESPAVRIPAGVITEFEERGLPAVSQNAMTFTWQVPPVNFLPAATATVRGWVDIWGEWSLIADDEDDGA